MLSRNRFYEAASFLPPFQQQINSIPKSVSSEAFEIRIRAGRPVIIETPTGGYICGTGKATPDEIEKCVQCFCEYSVHSHKRELNAGCITLKGGHRAAVSGKRFLTADNSDVIAEYSSINLRIAGEHIGISDNLYKETVMMSNFRGLLILGPPLSAKTTVLRDLCRNIGSRRKTAVIDERGEIAASYMGVPQNDIGLNTDVLTGFEKGEGIERAIRLFSPEYIICDEIGLDYKSVLMCADRGIKPILTQHCGDIYEAAKNIAVNSLVKSGMVNYIAVMGDRYSIGTLKGIWYINDSEAFCGNTDNGIICGCRNCMD